MQLPLLHSGICITGLTLKKFLPFHRYPEACFNATWTHSSLPVETLPRQWLGVYFHAVHVTASLLHPQSLPTAPSLSLEGAGHTAPVWSVPICRVSNIGSCCNAFHSIQIWHSSYNKGSLVLLHSLKEREKSLPWGIAARKPGRGTGGWESRGTESQMSESRRKWESSCRLLPSAWLEYNIQAPTPHSIFLALSAFLNRTAEELEKSEGSPQGPTCSVVLLPWSLPLPWGAGKPRLVKPFKPHLWDNAIMTLHLPRTVRCQGR